MMISQIDEINAYHNKDGSYTVEINSGSDTITIAHANLDLVLNNNFGDANLVITLEGGV